MFGSDRESEKEGSVLGRETAAEAGPDQGTSGPSSSDNQSEVVDLTPHLSTLLSHQSPIGADPAGSDDYSAPIGPDDISQTRAGGPVQPVLKVLFKMQHGKRKKAL